MPRLSLYRASLLPPLRRALVPDRSGLRFLSLIPDPVEVPALEAPPPRRGTADEIERGELLMSAPPWQRPQWAP